MGDPLIAPFVELCGALRGLQAQVEQLARVHDAVDDFNSAFGAFQGAMALHASCLSYPKTPPVAKDKHVSPGTGIPLPSVSPNENGVHKKRDGSSGDKNKNKSKSSAESVNGDKQQQMKKKRQGPVAAGTKRQGKVEHHGPSNTRIKRRKTQMAKTAQPAWTWERRTLLLFELLRDGWWVH